MLCEAEIKRHITEKQYTNNHKIKHIQYTVYTVMPMVAQLIKIFPTILQNLQFITVHGKSFNGLLKHEQSKSILIQFPKIYFNIIFPYSHRLSEQTLSFLFSNQITSRLHSFPCIPHSLPICHCSPIPHYLTNSTNYETPHYTSFSPNFLCLYSKHYSLHSVLKQNQLINGKKHSPFLKALLYVIHIMHPYFN